MGKYLFIESRDPFESPDSLAFSYDLVQGLATGGNEVTFFLIQNGVLPTRKGSKYADRLAELSQGNVKVVADDFSLKERAIRRLVDVVKQSNAEELVDLMLIEGTKTIWH